MGEILKSVSRPLLLTVAARRFTASETCSAAFTDTWQGKKLKLAAVTLQRDDVYETPEGQKLKKKLGKEWKTVANVGKWNKLVKKLEQKNRRVLANFKKEPTMFAGFKLMCCNAQRCFTYKKCSHMKDPLCIAH